MTIILTTGQLSANNSLTFLKKSEMFKQKGAYIKMDFIFALNSYVDFLSKDLYKFFLYSQSFSQDAVMNFKILYNFLMYFSIKNRILFIKYYISNFSTINNKISKIRFCIKYLKKIFFNFENTTLKLNTNIFFEEYIKNAFSFAIKKIITLFKTPLFTNELLLFSFFKPNKNGAHIPLDTQLDSKILYQLSYNMLKLIYNHEKVCRKRIKMIFFTYLLKRELTFSEFCSLTNFFFAKNATLLFRNEIVNKSRKFSYTSELKDDFLTLLSLQKNTRFYSI